MRDGERQRAHSKHRIGHRIDQERRPKSKTEDQDRSLTAIEQRPKIKDRYQRSRPKTNGHRATRGNENEKESKSAGTEDTTGDRQREKRIRGEGVGVEVASKLSRWQGVALLPAVHGCVALRNKGEGERGYAMSSVHLLRVLLEVWGGAGVRGGGVWGAKQAKGLLPARIELATFRL